MMRICRRGFIDSNLSTIMSTMSTSESFLLIWKRNSPIFPILLYTRPLVSAIGYFEVLITQNFWWIISDQEIPKYSPLFTKNSSRATSLDEPEKNEPLFEKNIRWIHTVKHLSKERKFFLSMISSQQDIQLIRSVNSSKRLAHKR